MTLVVGLGNPGLKYRRTRHNMGFLVIDRLAGEHEVELATRKFSAKTGRGAIAGSPVLLAKPQTFMNLSGPSVASLAGYFRTAASDLVVVHDDLDIGFGRIKIKQGGGDAGHKGLASIIGALGSRDFVRVRVGIGRPAAGIDPVDYVLQEFTREERQGLEGVLDRAARAVEAVVSGGVTRAMNEFNR